MHRVPKRSYFVRAALQENKREPIVIGSNKAPSERGLAALEPSLDLWRSIDSRKKQIGPTSRAAAHCRVRGLRNMIMPAVRRRPQSPQQEAFGTYVHFVTYVPLGRSNGSGAVPELPELPVILVVEDEEL
jgi:hypothetical protein